MTLTGADFARIRAALGQQAEDDIWWAENECRMPATPEVYAMETIFVICNSGMKNTVARGIYQRVRTALEAGKSARSAFGHPGKAAAIDAIWAGRRDSHQRLLECPPERRLEFLAGTPWIGEITKYHLAKNFGLPVAKPDVHLQRLADREGCTAQALCERLAAEVGLGVAAVDTVLWRACANGVLDSRSGEICT